MKTLVILEGPAYGTDANYNGLRLAGNFAKRDGVEVKIFCFGDAVGCAVAKQQFPTGCYYLDRMLASAAHLDADLPDIDHDTATDSAVLGRSQRNWSLGCRRSGSYRLRTRSGRFPPTSSSEMRCRGR